MTNLQNNGESVNTSPSYSIKKRKRRGFTQIDNDVFNSSLSFHAQGLLGFMLSKPDEWTFTIPGLIRASGTKTTKSGKEIPKNGRDSILGMISELKAAGFIQVTQTRTQGAFRRNVYHLTDVPFDFGEQAATGNSVHGEQAATGKTVNGKTVAGNSDTYKYSIGNKEDINSNTPQGPPGVEEVEPVFFEGEEEVFQRIDASVGFPKPKPAESRLPKQADIDMVNISKYGASTLGQLPFGDQAKLLREFCVGSLNDLLFLWSSDLTAWVWRSYRGMNATEKGAMMNDAPKRVLHHLPESRRRYLPNLKNYLDPEKRKWRDKIRKLDLATDKSVTREEAFILRGLHPEEFPGMDQKFTSAPGQSPLGVSVFVE